MRRRDFMSLLAGTLGGWPSAVRAQQKAVPVVGFLSPVSEQHAPALGAFRQGLSETGYIEGQNLRIEYRWAENNYDRLPALAADLVGRKVDLIVSTAVAASVAAKNATSTIPIVFMGVSDPIALGLVASLARPGGNITGFSPIVSQLTAKRLELMSELAPQAKVIGLLINPNSPTTHNEPLITDLEKAARAKDVRLAVLKAGTEGEIDAAFASLVELQASGLVVAGDPFMLSRRDQLVVLASRHAIPAIYHLRSFVVAGGLISYGVNDNGVMTRVGSYAGRILNGTKPADLPVQEPTTFELVINIRTAKSLGLTVPPSIFSRANEVID